MERDGKCLCGDVTFAVAGPPDWSLFCHCESCRTQCASPVTAFFGVSDGQWKWTGETPSIYESGKGIRRYFCNRCGTPVAYDADKFPGEIHFYLVHLDNVSGFEPKGHVHALEAVAWCNLEDQLPRWRDTMGAHLLK